MVKSRMTKIRWNKPTYTGFRVLELSKLLMYRFHYDYIPKRINTGPSFSLPTRIHCATSCTQTTGTPT